MGEDRREGGKQAKEGGPPVGAGAPALAMPSSRLVSWLWGPRRLGGKHRHRAEPPAGYEEPGAWGSHDRGSIPAEFWWGDVRGAVASRPPSIYSVAAAVPLSKRSCSPVGLHEELFQQVPLVGPRVHCIAREHLNGLQAWPLPRGKGVHAMDDTHAEITPKIKHVPFNQFSPLATFHSFIKYFSYTSFSAVFLHIWVFCVFFCVLCFGDDFLSRE